MGIAYSKKENLKYIRKLSRFSHHPFVPLTESNFANYPIRKKEAPSIYLQISQRK